MRIAWVTYGFEEYSAYHVNALCQEHECLVVIPGDEDGATRCPIDPSIDLYAFSKPRLREPFKQWLCARRILKRVHDFHPDVVHFQGGHMWFNFALNSLRRYPLVLTIHDPRHHAGDRNSRKTPQWLMDYGFRKADHVIVHGEALAVEVNEIFALERERIHVVPMIARGEETVGNEVEEDQNLILFFGRIWDYKGLDQLIAAQPLINDVVPDARIMIAGQGEDFGRYRALMQDSSKFIVHNEWVSDELRAQFFQRSAIVALPYNEATQSGVVPVAYNYGKPVVATRVGALPECIDDGVTGLLIPPRDPQAIADAVIDLLKNPERRRQMGRAGKAKLDRECSPSVVAQRTADAYRSAIKYRGKHATGAVSLERQEDLQCGS
ncbi:glycosyltransferase family 4 protein [Novipirellula artificiosorum]|uniref:Glycogen synthase n=1 Tax=Novipirellula artificiosorum TaxID=2528016 RepID=A0A5C6DDR7_9BACT|nr:glycosyltransferase family 4 protein [Novipirellula artificiosorum]TWU34940.1 Glycogen synthase [Novipirellula artificiosorum]